MKRKSTTKLRVGLRNKGIKKAHKEQLSIEAAKRLADWQIGEGVGAKKQRAKLLALLSAK